MNGAPVDPHQGLYLRLMLGGAYDQMTNSADSSTTIHGGAVALDMHIGYFIAPNFAIGADLAGSSVAGPTITMNGMDITAANSTQLTFTMIGAGATYFVPDPNLYVAGSIGIARGQIQDGSGNTSRSPDGWGLNLLAGKEWWVSPHWGVGVAAHFFYIHLPEDTSSASTTDIAVGGGLLFSSSYSGG